MFFPVTPPLHALSLSLPAPELAKILIDTDSLYLREQQILGQVEKALYEILRSDIGKSYIGEPSDFKRMAVDDGLRYVRQRAGSLPHSNRVALLACYLGHAIELLLLVAVNDILTSDEECLLGSVDAQARHLQECVALLEVEAPYLQRCQEVILGKLNRLVSEGKQPHDRTECLLLERMADELDERFRLVRRDGVWEVTQGSKTIGEGPTPVNAALGALETSAIQRGRFDG